MTPLFVLAQQPPGFAGTLVQMTPFLLVLVIFYFFVFRPAIQKQKNLQAMIAALKRGDKVVTNGGLYGEIVSIDGETAILKIADNVKVKISRSAITALDQPSDKASSDKALAEKGSEP